MNEIKLFNFEGNKIRTILESSEILFVGKDVAGALGYKDERDALSRHVDKEDKIEKIVKTSQMRQNASNVNDSQGPFQNVTLINESGVYSLIFASHLPKAKDFKHWVTSEVLPSIRKTGSYEKLPQTPEEKLALTMEAAIHLDKRVSEIEKTVADIKEKAEVDEGQRYQLLQARKAKVISACGGTDSNYYIEKKAKKVFSEFGRDFKKAFKIPRYDCLKSKKFDEAMKFTKNWYPSFVLQREIQNVNAQTKLNLL